VALDSVRTAGCPPGPEAAVFAASAADVRHVVASGQVIVVDGLHQRLPDLPHHLDQAIRGVTS
jgi:hypothetical protein